MHRPLSNQLARGLLAQHVLAAAELDVERGVRLAVVELPTSAMLRPPSTHLAHKDALAVWDAQHSWQVSLQCRNV